MKRLLLLLMVCNVFAGGCASKGAVLKEEKKKKPASPKSAKLKPVLKKYATMTPEHIPVKPMVRPTPGSKRVHFYYCRHTYEERYH